MRQQFAVRSGFGDLAFLQNHQAIHACDGRQAVRDGDHGLALHQRLQALLNRRFDFRVECRGGFVHDQDRRVLEQHAGDRDTLALTAGQLDAALTDMGVEAGATFGVREQRDELVGARLVNRIPELFISCVRIAIQQVLANRAVQQRGVLGDHADLRAQAFLGDFGNILAVDEDPPALHVVHAQQQVDQRRLARAGRSDQADLLTRSDVQVEVVNDPVAIAVMEIDAVEPDAAVFDLQRQGAVFVIDGDGLRDTFQAVLHGADVLEDAVDHPHDPAGHVDDADDQTGGQCDRTHRDHRLRPQPKGQTGGRDDQYAVHGGDGGVHRGDHAASQLTFFGLIAHRFASVLLLVVGVGEQLERGDVGVAVDDAAHQS
ncbi:Transposase, family [Pseudomonas syringae pv. aptata]|nr:Transposase, family [Pseudomonas syringae pv. aptata]